MLKGNDDGMMSIRHERAQAAGLTYRPLAVTVRDTQAWWATVSPSRLKSPKFTISPGKNRGARRLACSPKLIEYLPMPACRWKVRRIASTSPQGPISFGG